MTIQQLMDAVANLGFESELNDVDVISPTVFFPALNKAVYKVNEIRPRMGEISFAHNPIKSVYVFDQFAHTDKDIVMNGGNSVAFSFKANGEISFSVSVTANDGIIDSAVTVTANGDEIQPDTNGVYSLARNASGYIVKGYVGKRNGATPDVTVTFIGDFYYSISRFSYFGNAYSSDVNDVPLYSEYVSYSLPTIAKDFLSMQRGSVTDSDGNILRYADDYLVKNDRDILLPWYCRPLYINVTYTRKLWQYSVDGAVNEYGEEVDGGLQTDIDIDEDLAQLLPNLVAFYVLQDDEPQKANNYYQIFMSEYNEKKSLERRTSPTPYDLRNTWG